MNHFRSLHFFLIFAYRDPQDFKLTSSIIFSLIIIYDKSAFSMILSYDYLDIEDNCDHVIDIINDSLNVNYFFGVSTDKHL